MFGIDTGASFYSYAPQSEVAFADSVDALSVLRFVLVFAFLHSLRTQNCTSSGEKGIGNRRGLFYGQYFGIMEKQISFLCFIHSRED